MLDSLSPDQSCVLDVPPIIPDDWTAWWQLWESRKEVEVLPSQHNPNRRGYWVGLDIYRSATYKPNDWKYVGHYLDATHLFPRMFETIRLIPAKLDVVRAVSSYAKFSPHTDWPDPAISLRSMLWDENPQPTFFYQRGDQKVYQTLPKGESNTWVYRDHGLKHGSDFDPQYQKVLLMYQGSWDWDALAHLVHRSKQRFREHIK